MTAKIFGDLEKTKRIWNSEMITIQNITGVTKRRCTIGTMLRKMSIVADDFHKDCFEEEETIEYSSQIGNV